MSCYIERCKTINGKNYFKNLSRFYLEIDLKAIHFFSNLRKSNWKLKNYIMGMVYTGKITSVTKHKVLSPRSKDWQNNAHSYFLTEVKFI